MTRAKTPTTSLTLIQDHQDFWRGGVGGIGLTSGALQQVQRRFLEYSRPRLNHSVDRLVQGQELGPPPMAKWLTCPCLGPIYRLRDFVT